MLHKLTLTAAVLSLMVGTGTGWAQSLAEAEVPAEFPPASYTGSQYVDSRGCVYVRAGFDDAVTWVPRVSRNRQVLCGFTPTFATARTPEPEPEADVATAPATTPPRTQTQTATTTPTTTVRTPTATTTTVRTQTATAAPRTRTVTTQPRTRTVTTPPRTRTTATPPPRSTTTTRCGATALSDRYLRTTSGYPVRCGPQRANPRDGASLGAPGSYYRYRGDLAPVFTPPEGYQLAFDDDRLNPRRGPLTAQGNYEMRQVWDSSLPRRLVESEYAGGEFPMGRAETDGFTISAKNPPATTSVASTPVQRVRAPAATTTAHTGHRYVQVGTFSGDAEAQNSAARLRAMGLPVRTGNYLKAGKTYRIVLAGPFNDATQLQRGLSAARQAGFSGAYTRR